MKKLTSLLNVILVLSSIVTGCCGPKTLKTGIQGSSFYPINFNRALKLPANPGFGPRDIQVDAKNETAYVIGEFAGILAKVSIDLTKSETVTQVAKNLLVPTALAVDWSGKRAYITREWSATRRVGWDVLTSVPLAGGPGLCNYVLADSTGKTLVPWQPVGIARGKSGRLYIADTHPKGKRLIGVDLNLKKPQKKPQWWVIQAGVSDIRAVAVDANEDYVYYTTSQF